MVKNKIIRIIVSAVLLMICIMLPTDGAVRLLTFLVPYIVIGWNVLKESAENILHGELFDENFLMAAATIGAFALGDYTEAAAVMLFYEIGEAFQDYAVDKSRDSIAELMDIRPDYANIESEGKLIRTEPDKVGVGDIITVMPGEKIPLDGIVTEGTSSVNTSALTGESLPHEIDAGDEVMSGCVNISGLIKLQVTKPFGESTASKILELVANAESKKAKTENFITKFARIYTPVVVISAVLLAVIPSLITGEWQIWVNRALIFLVISCPCALVISIPLSFFGGIGGASSKGILVKGSNYLEALSKADTFVFDKTGTLTEGKFTVTAVHPEKISEEELLELAAAAESYSNHPVSQSLRTAHAKTIDKSRIGDVREIAGQGVIAVIDGEEISVGNGRLMESVKADWRECHKSGTVIHIAKSNALSINFESEYMGHIVISDVAKQGAAKALQQLKEQGISRVVMLTGDSESVGRSVASELGIDEYHTELLPDDKVKHIESLLKTDGTLVFVGDGVNDAPVLTRADIGIAMGAMGSDAAIEAADIVLMDDDISKLPMAIGIARRTMLIVKENIVFTLCVKLLFLILGALGIAEMWWAVFADVGVALIAVLNALRVLKVK